MNQYGQGRRKAGVEASKFEPGDRILLDCGAWVRVIDSEPCGSFSRRDRIYSFDAGFRLTGREIALNTAKRPN